MFIIDCEQRSEQWFAERLGKPSASNFDSIITSTGVISKSRQSYMYELVAQILTGKAEEGFRSPAMDEGVNREDESRKLYEMIKDVSVKQVGMIFPDQWKQYLCSPDGFIEDHQYGLELKNVLPKTQIGYLLANKLPTSYFCQVQGSMLVTGFDRWDFCSYAPGLPPLIIECHRDETWIKKMEVELNAFLTEMLSIVERLKKL